MALATPARAVAPGEIVVADFPAAAPQPSALVRFDAAGMQFGIFPSQPPNWTVIDPSVVRFPVRLLSVQSPNKAQ